jgi:hypothetical protein
MNPGLDPARRQRQAAHILVLLLREHASLPVLTWTITVNGLHAHVDLCDVDSDRDRRVFTTWVAALHLTPHPEPASEPTSPAHLHAHRHINGLLVTLTATVHPF